MRKLIEKIEKKTPGVQGRVYTAIDAFVVFEEKVEPPPGFEGKTVTSTIKRVGYSDVNPDGGLSFFIAGNVYDDYLKDQVAAIDPGLEKSIEYLRKAKYTDDEMQQVFDDAREGDRWRGVELPRPVKIKWTVFRRKW